VAKKSSTKTGKRNEGDLSLQSSVIAFPGPIPPTDEANAFQVKVTLTWTKPPIWRRLLVPPIIPLDWFHAVLQSAMGWGHEHLHQFVVGRTYFSSPEFGLEEVEDECAVTLGELLNPANKKIVYEYDFGDGWMHDIALEKTVVSKEPLKHAVCLTGAGRCPLEDCGGVNGYYNLLAVLSDPKHPEHNDMKEWAGGPIDPDEFNLDSINQGLRKIAFPSKKSRRRR